MIPRNTLEYYQKKKTEKEDCEVHRELFEAEIEWGPVFPCVCCRRDLFKRGVVKINDALLNFFEEEKLDNFVDLSLEVNGSNYICFNCKLILTKKIPNC